MKTALAWFAFVLVSLLSGCGAGPDADGDGFVNCAEVVHDWPRSDDADCLGDGAGLYGGFNPLVNDCDDNDPAINPDADETCDGLDNNCNGLWDEGSDANDLALDCDDDGFVQLGLSDGSDDCDPWDAAVNPDAPEINDGRDDNCDGQCLSEECSDDLGSSCPCRGTVTTVPFSDPGCQCGTTPSLKPLWLLALTVIGLRRRANNTSIEKGEA